MRQLVLNNTLHPQTLRFLSNLKKNNNKEFMDAHRDLWAEIRTNLCSFVDVIIMQLSAYDKTIAAESAKTSVFRINRDIRFSKNKSPYKENIGAFVSAGGKKSNGAGYYLHIEPGGNTFLAGGAYGPDAASLFRIRQEVDYNGKVFEKIIKAASFRKHFDFLDEQFRVTRFPKGFDANSAYAKYLPYASYVAITPAITDKTVVSSLFFKQTLEAFRSMVPLNQFLNTAIHDQA
jgi:uncharacterized protein (TIGR02453 family)